MGYTGVSICLAATLSLAAASPTQKDTINLTGDWNITAKDTGGVVQYGAWRISQQSTQLEVVSRWAHFEGLKQSSGTISENGRVLIIGGPTDGWMESFSGLVSPDGSEITGTWSRVEGINSFKGTFKAQRARAETSEASQPEPRPGAAPAVEAGGRPLVEAPGSQPETRPAPQQAASSTPTPAAAPVIATPVDVAPPAPAQTSPPPLSEVAPTAEQPAERVTRSQELAELEGLLTILIEQNQLLIRQAADVRNQAPNKDQLLAAQLEKQQRVFKLLEKLIHSKVELEELLELFRRGNRTP